MHGLIANWKAFTLTCVIELEKQSIFSHELNSA